MDPLFTPFTFGSLTVPNRLVRSATAERMAEPDGAIPQKTLDFYRRLTQGGVGLIITGHMYVHPTGKAHPEMTGVYDDHLLEGLSQLAEVIHREGGLVAVQINHAGLKADLETVEEPLAPSAVEDERLSSRTPRALTVDEIEELIGAFGQAARRVQEAGFDAVQIHAAHGYLISQFLSPAANQRTDEWGGSLENRMRFFRQVADAVRAQVGADYPVFTKLGVRDGFDDGLTLDDGAQVAASLKDMGLDAVELSGGFGMITQVNSWIGVRRPEREAYFLSLAKAAREVTDLPLMLVGGFRSRPVMERVLADGDADFISMCRPLINNPDFPNKLRSGEMQVSDCISANNCWAREMNEGIACKCPVEKVEI
ncbi:MAG: NADH:flavin oxidoreductase [Anaerolineales bacterium]